MTRIKSLWQELRQTAKDAAQRVTAETLQKERLASEGLQLLCPNHVIKVGLVLRLRQRPPRTLSGLPRNGVQAGSWKYPSNLLNQEPHTLTEPDIHL